MAFKLTFYRTDVVGGEASPNTTPPAVERVFLSPRDEEGGYSALLWTGDGTSLEITIWFRDATSASWVPVTKPLTIKKDEVQYAPVPPNVELFLQFGTNIGSVTKFGMGFVAVAAVAASAASGAAPIGEVSQGAGGTDPWLVTGQVSSANRTIVAASVTEIQLIAANPARMSILIRNFSDSPLYVGCGALAVTEGNASFVVAAKDHHHLIGWSGELRGIWQAATGSVVLTEMTT